MVGNENLTDAGRSASMKHFEHGNLFESNGALRLILSGIVNSPPSRSGTNDSHERYISANIAQSPFMKREHITAHKGSGDLLVRQMTNEGIVSSSE